MLEFCAHIEIEKHTIGQAMWAELDWTASYDIQPLRKGKAAFELFVLYALGRYSPDISLQDALGYITSAALSGFGPAFVVGKRLFLANDMPVPDVIQKGPPDADLRRHIELLEGLPNEKYYSAAVRIFWSAHVRNVHLNLQSKIRVSFYNSSATDFMDWMQELNKDMDSGAFKVFAKQNFFLHQAVASGCCLAVDYLLHLDCNINNEAPGGITPLHLACRLADVTIIDQLVANGADASLEASDNTVPLHWLVLLDEDQVRPVAEALVKSGAVINTLNSANAYFDELGLEVKGSPFHWACQCCNQNVIEVLLDLGAIPIEVEGLKRPLQLGFLHDPLATVSPEITEVLLRHHDFYLHLDSLHKEGIFYFIGMGGSNEFQRWAMHGNFYSSAYRDILEVLYRYGISLPLKPRATLDIRYYTPLSRAAISHNFHLMKELLRLGANVNDLSPDPKQNTVKIRQTALDFAITSSDIINSPQKVCKVVELLLQHGATTNYVQILPKSGFYLQTAIHTACTCYASASLIRLLAKASPDEVNEKVGGQTPLHEACMWDDDALSKVQALTESGADLYIETDHDRKSKKSCCLTALAISLFALNWPVAKYLLEQGSPTMFGGYHKQSVLHLMVFMAVKSEARNHPRELAALFSTIESLLDHPVARQKDLLNATDFRGNSPVRMAVYFGLPRLLKILLKNRCGECSEIKDIVEGRVSLTEYMERIPHFTLPLLPFVVPDDIDIEMSDEGCEIGGYLCPWVKASVFQKRIEDVKKILESSLPGFGKQPLPLASF
jgi:ankyrin repeat protein